MLYEQKQDPLDREIDDLVKANSASPQRKPKQPPMPKQSVTPQPAPQSSYFETSFGDIQKGFRSKYGRDFEITGGADTPMHQKLHKGLGRDVRSKTLSQEEGDYLINEGKARGFDVRDFRTAYKDYGFDGPHIHFDVGGKDDLDHEINSLLLEPEEAPKVQADWSAGAPRTDENTKAMVDELLANRHAAAVNAQPAPKQNALDEEPLMKLSTNDRPLVPQNSVSAIPSSNAQPGIQSPVERYGINHSLRVDDLVDGVVDVQGNQSFKLKEGVTPEQFQTALFERANAQQGFDQASLERYRQEKGQYPVGRFFQGADPSNPDLGIDELLKWVKADEGGNLQFLYNVPNAQRLAYQRFLQPEAKEQAVSTAQDLEAEQSRQARERTTIADKAGKVLTEVSPVGALAGIAETVSPEAAKNLRQYEENLVSKASLGYIDPTNVSIGAGEKNDSIGGEVGGMLGGAVPIVAATALGGPGAGVAAAGVQPFLERRQGESDYDFQTRAQDAALNAMLTAVGGKVSGEQLSLLRKMALDQIVFTGGTAMLKPLTHGEYASWKELGAGAALGIGMSTLHGLNTPEGKPANAPEFQMREEGNPYRFEEAPPSVFDAANPNLRPTPTEGSPIKRNALDDEIDALLATPRPEPQAKPSPAPGADKISPPAIIENAGAKTPTGPVNENGSKISPPKTVAKPPVDKVAHTAATSPKNDLTVPTQPQKDAGNFKMGHTKIGGFDVSIEYPAGVRRKPDHIPLKSHYGYIKRQHGADGEHLDVFIKKGTPESHEGPVFVVDQVTKEGKFDEQKVLMGFSDEQSARAGYNENYPKDWQGLGAIREFTNGAEFKEWLKTANMKKPTSEKPLPKPVSKEAAEVKVSDYVNLDKYRLSEDEKAHLSRAVQEQVVDTPDIKRRVTFDDIKREAAELAPELVDDLKPPKPGESLHPAVYYAAKQRMQALMAESVKIRGQIEAKGKQLTPDEVAKLEEQAARLDADAKSLLDVVIPARSANGRNLAFERMMVDNSGFDVVRHVVRAQKIAERSGVDIKGKDYQAKETRLRETVATGKAAESRLAEIQASLGHLREDPAVKAFEEALRETRRIKSAAKKEDGVLDVPKAKSVARRKVAEGWKVKLSDAEAAARLRLKERLNPNTVHDITDIASMTADLAVIGAAKLARKGIDKAVWARELIDEFGEHVTPHLGAIFKRSVEIYKSERSAAYKAARELRFTGGDPTKFTQTQVEKLLVEAETHRRAALKARVDLARQYMKLEKTHIATFISSARKTGMLAPINMIVRDFIGTGLQQAVNTADHGIAAFTDMIVGSVTGRRTVAGVTPPMFGHSVKEMMTTGIKDFGDILKHGASEKELENMNLPSEVVGDGVVTKVGAFYINGVGRIRSGLDNLWSRYAYNLSLESYAKAQAMTEAKQGKISRKGIARRTEELIAKHPEEMAADVVFTTEMVREAADYATYHSDNKLSSAIRAGKEKLGPWGAALFETFILPFERTTSNIYKMLLYDYTPLSPIVQGIRTSDKVISAAMEGARRKSFKAIRDGFRESFSPEDQRKLVTSIARGAISGPVGLVAVGYILGSKGWITGSRETTYSEIERDKAAGTPPMAIYNPLFKTYHQLGLLGPYGVMLGIGAEWAQSDLRGALRAGYQEAKNLPYIRAARQVSDVLEGKSDFGSFMGRTLSPFIPAPVPDIAQATDFSKTEREVKGFMPQLESKIPGLRNKLPEAQDRMGLPIERRWTDIFDPTKTRSVKTDSVYAELDKYNIGLTKPKPKAGEPDEEFRKRVTATGKKVYEMLLSLINDDWYKKFDDEGRKKLLADEVAVIKKKASEEAKERYGVR